MQELPDFVNVKFSVEVGSDRYFSYKKTGEVEVTLVVPKEAVFSMNLEGVLKSLLPAAIEKYKHLDEEE